MKNSFIEKIHNTAPAIGTLVTLESPEIAEILSSCGFDWLFLDMEHGILSPATAQHLMQAMKQECSAIVRIPENSAVWIKKALDTGCDGIIVPQVTTGEEAKKAVKAAKYPPQGERSVGIARAQGYGMQFTEYVQSANTTIALIIQIEHIDAVNNLDAILAVDGIDGVLIGPYDLSGSMHVLGDVTNESVQKAISTVKETCKNKNVPFGIFVANAEAAQKEIADECSFIAVGIDSMLLAQTAQSVLATVKGISK